MNKIEKLVSIVNSDMLMAMVQEVNSWDSSLDYLDFIDMGLLDDYLGEYTPTEIANKIHYGDFNPYHEYFRFDAYGNLESFQDWNVEEDLNWYKTDIVERFVELYEDGHVDSYYQEVTDILDEEEEEEEEEA